MNLSGNPQENRVAAVSQLPRQDLPGRLAGQRQRVRRYSGIPRHLHSTVWFLSQGQAKNSLFPLVALCDASRELSAVNRFNCVSCEWPGGILFKQSRLVVMFYINLPSLFALNRCVFAIMYKILSKILLKFIGEMHEEELGIRVQFFKALHWSET